MFKLKNSHTVNASNLRGTITSKAQARQLSAESTEYQITKENAYFSSVIARANGGFTVVWQYQNHYPDYCQESLESKIMVQSYHANGTVDGDAFQANTETFVSVPRIAELTNGNLAIVYESFFTNNTLESTPHVYYSPTLISVQIRDASGNLQVGPFYVDMTYNDIASYYSAEYFLSITAFAGNEFSLMWQKHDPNIYAIKRFNASGHEIGETHQLTSCAGKPSIAALVDGGFAIGCITYEPYRNLIYMQRFYSNGSHINMTLPTVLSYTDHCTPTPSIPSCVGADGCTLVSCENSRDIGSVAVTQLPNAGFALSWEIRELITVTLHFSHRWYDGVNSGDDDRLGDDVSEEIVSDHYLVMQKFNLNGVKEATGFTIVPMIGSAYRGDSALTYNQDFSVTPLAHGGFVLNKINSHTRITQKLDANWIQEGGTSVASFVQTSSIAVLSDDGFIVIDDRGNSASEMDNKTVVAQRFDASGNKTVFCPSDTYPTAFPTIQPTIISTAAPIMSVSNTEFQVRTGGEYPQVFGLAHGEFVIICVDGRAWYGQIYHQNGQKKGSEFLLISPCASGVAIAKLANSGFVAACNHFYDRYKILVTRFDLDANGNSMEYEFEINMQTSLIQLEVNALADGGFAIIWNEATTRNFLLQLYNSDLSKRGDVQIYNGYLASMSVTGLADGRFVMSLALPVHYRCYNHGISFRIYNANGTQNSSDITIITDSPPSYSFNNVALGDGKFLVGIPGYRSIYIETYDADNSKDQAKIQIDGHNDLYIFALANSQFLVGWNDASNATFQVYNFDGTKNGTKRSLRISKNYLRWGSSIALLTENETDTGFVAIWASGDKIMGQRFDINGNPIQLCQVQNCNVNSSTTAALLSIGAIIGIIVGSLFAATLCFLLCKRIAFQRKSATYHQKPEKSHDDRIPPPSTSIVETDRIEPALIPGNLDQPIVNALPEAQGALQETPQTFSLSQFGFFNTPPAAQEILQETPRETPQPQCGLFPDSSDDRNAQESNDIIYWEETCRIS